MSDTDPWDANTSPDNDPTDEQLAELAQHLDGASEQDVADAILAGFNWRAALGIEEDTDSDPLMDPLPDEPAHGYQTRTGFVFGPAEVTRMRFLAPGGDTEHYVIDISTARRNCKVYISPKGHSIRVVRGGKELS